MPNFFTRQSGAHANDVKRSLGALLGIAQGLICDNVLNDAEIRFLGEWLRQNDAIANAWPGDVVYARVRAVLGDGGVTNEERRYLTETLQQLIGANDGELAAPTHVSQMAFDDLPSLNFEGERFCLTGDFVFASRDVCAAEIKKRGGTVLSSVTKKLRYLVVGSRGSKEWKHGSFGTKVEQAMKLKQEGLPVFIVPENRWTSCLSPSVR